jgi:2-amino-4-hydroxy-6-hydroxymethyldihydropteridine diphosphokinase
VIECYLGLGANQQDPVRLLNQSCDHIRRLPQTQLGIISEIIITEPFGILGQPIFYNQVIQIFTKLPSQTLLKHILEIEMRLGKIKSLTWGPRKIDIDLLIYGNTFLKTKTLTLPHPQIWQRPFVTKQLQAFESPLIHSYFQENINIQSLLDSKKPNNLPGNIETLFKSKI